MGYLRDVNLVSVILRLFLAFLCGAIIGYERETKRKPAGLRTHILICIGAAMTTMTSEYLVLVMHQYTDMARLGAQVISGIGFIGAGVIIVTRQRRVKGLTTAAGLWTSAIIGLACGAGYYEGALTAAVLIILVEYVIARFEDGIRKTPVEIIVQIEYANTRALNHVLAYIKALDIQIDSIDIQKDEDGSKLKTEMSLTLHRKILSEDLVQDLSHLNGIYKVEII